MEGLVTWQASSTSLSKMRSYGRGLPIEDSSTPPVSACFHTAFLSSVDQLSLSRKVSAFFSMVMQCAGQNVTHR